MPPEGAGEHSVMSSQQLTGDEKIRKLAKTLKEISKGGGKGVEGGIS